MAGDRQSTARGLCRANHRQHQRIIRPVSDNRVRESAHRGGWPGRVVASSMRCQTGAGRLHGSRRALLCERRRVRESPSPTRIRLRDRDQPRLDVEKHDPFRFRAEQARRAPAVRQTHRPGWTHRRRPKPGPALHRRGHDRSGRVGAIDGSAKHWWRARARPGGVHAGTAGRDRARTGGRTCWSSRQALMTCR